MTATLFLDECGYTGEHLTDEQQPVLVVASHTFDESESAALKRHYFSESRGAELKHKALCGRKRHQEALIAFFTEIAAGSSVAVAIAHKRFALALKVVDCLIEPSMHAAGFDLNAHGGHFGLAEVIFAYMFDDRVRRAVELYERAARSRAAEHIEDFVKQLRNADEAMGQPLFRGPAMHLGRAAFTSLPKNALDISLPLALELCYCWNGRGLKKFAVFHDRSSKMAEQRQVWDALLSRDAPPALVGRGANVIAFPIGVASTTFGDSLTSAALQVADLIAGALATWAKWMLAGRSQWNYYASTLHEVLTPHLEALVAHSIWPSGTIERWPSTPPGVVDPDAYSAPY
jgi:hypothetical protein